VRERHGLSVSPRLAGAPLFATALLSLLAACDQQPALIAPPPSPVVVASPLRQDIVDYATFTGQTAPVQSVDLMARVPGYLRKVEFADGTDVPADKELFLIEPEPYEAQVALAQATVEQHQAQLKSAEAEFERQQILQQQSVSTQANYDRALANRDSERAAVAEAQANLTTAKINLSYTKVLAPFAGRIGRRLVDPGNLVGQGAPTKLATIQDIDRIYVYFTAAEPDVLRFRRSLAKEGMTRETISRIPVEAGLQDDSGYPYRGRLDFADTGVDTTTGTLQARAVIDNADKRLIPGLFTRLRIPLGPPAPALLLPETAFGVDQVGSYVMAVDKDDVVSLRRVATGPAQNGLRVVASGVGPEDRIVVEGIQNAAPGRKVAVRQGEIAARAAP
jgi:RND family efflux transporter MFP subunit